MSERRQMTKEELLKRQREGAMKMGPGMGRGNFGKILEKPKDMKKTLKHMAKYVSLCKYLFISLVVVVIVETLVNLYNNVLVKDIIKSLGEFDTETNWFKVEPDENLFNKSLLLLGICYFISCITRYLSSIFSAFITRKMEIKLRKDLFDKITYLPISYIDTHQHGDMMSRMTNDISSIINAFSQSITSLISSVITILGCLGIMIYYSPLLTLVACGVLMITLVVSFVMSKYVRPLFIKQQQILGVLNSETEEMVTGCKTVIAFNRQAQACVDFNKASDDLTKFGIKANIIGGSMGPVMNFVGNLGYFAVCIFGSLFIVWGIGRPINGEILDASIVIMFLGLVKRFTAPINQIAQLYTTIVSAIACGERIFELIDEKSEDFTGSETLDGIVGNIDFNHIKFGYNKDKVVLKDFDVKVYSGHKIALVGATGSGKTTVTNLLLRYYDIDSGLISIDGVNIANVSKKELRDNISIVLQDPVLFGDTIENNIRYAKSDATDEEIDKALEYANCKSFVDRLPEGKKTILTEGATNISQGQRQLLTIARAILANPKILILDEATSSVDTRTEKNIQDAMANLMKDRTSIVIAHRLSTIQDADLIVVLDDGVVVEQGNHSELILKGGKYAKLYQTQFSGIDI